MFELATLNLNKCKWSMHHFFLYCPITAVSEFNSFNIGSVNAVQKELYLKARNWQANKKFAIINAIAVSLF